MLSTITYYINIFKLRSSVFDFVLITFWCATFLNVHVKSFMVSAFYVDIIFSLFSWSYLACWPVSV